jgi:ABC-2 type transport system permease protein
MKTVFKIAKTELRTLFYSPIAWFLIIVFLFQCSLSYINMLNSNAVTQEVGGRGLEYMAALTSRIFAGRGGVFGSIMEKLYFYIPLLTMGLISRETSSGTIKLLYSSPVNVWEIVLGKYVSMMIYSLLMVGMFGILIVAAYFNIQHVELRTLLSAALGFYLLLCAYSAIGLFMSCLTTYQVVAAVCSFIMLGFLSYIGQLWQGIDFVRDLTYFLSLTGRSSAMTSGLITSKDIIYFILITYIFLGLSIYRLKATRESKTVLVNAGRYTMIVVSALLIGYITSRPKFILYADVTNNHTHTLTPNAQRIIKNFGDDKLEVTVYNNLLGQFYYFGLPEQRNSFLQIWEPYLRFKPDIDFKYVNYYDSSFERNAFSAYSNGGKEPATLKEKAQQLVKSAGFKMSWFKSPEEIHKIINLRPELNRFVMQLKYKDRTTYLRVFNDQVVFPGETEVSAAFKRLQQAKMPKIIFLTGNLERSIYKTGDRNYQVLASEITFRNSLVNQGFDVDSVSLDTQEIPADITALVIADPKSELSPVTLAKVQQYIDKGGNLFIAGEPGKQSLLNPFLQQFGVQLMDGMIVQKSKDLAPDLVLANLTVNAKELIHSLDKPFKDSTVVSMPTATGLSYTTNSGYAVKELVVTNEKGSWLTKSRIVADSADVVFNAAQGDIKQSLPTVLGLSRKINGREQHIVIAGDADFMSVKELGRYNPTQTNFALSVGIYSWLDNKEFPIDTSRPPSEDNRVNISTDGVDLLRIFLVWLLPAAVLVFAAILLIRRKRK